MRICGRLVLGLRRADAGALLRVAPRGGHGEREAEALRGRGVQQPPQLQPPGRAQRHLLLHAQDGGHGAPCALARHASGARPHGSALLMLNGRSQVTARPGACHDGAWLCMHMPVDD